jgi:DNA-binding transcriptional regulator YbjK
MHLDWPENTHWDQGALNHTRRFEEVGDMEFLTVEQQKQLRNFLDELQTRLGAGTARAAAAQVATAVDLAHVDDDEPVPTDGITQADADVRYAPKKHPHSGTASVEVA